MVWGPRIWAGARGGGSDAGWREGRGGQSGAGRQAGWKPESRTDAVVRGQLGAMEASGGGGDGVGWGWADLESWVIRKTEGGSQRRSPWEKRSGTWTRPGARGHMERWGRAQETGWRPAEMGTHHLCCPRGVRAEDHPGPAPECVPGDSRSRRPPNSRGGHAKAWE